MGPKILRTTIFVLLVTLSGSCVAMGAKAIGGVPASGLCRLHLDATVQGRTSTNASSETCSHHRGRRKEIGQLCPTAAWLATALTRVRQERSVGKRLAIAALEERERATNQ